MLISIIIPTRERAEYLRSSLATCVTIPDPEIEIVVSDNASNDETRAVVESFDDPRLVYVNTGQRVSMRQNFNFAIEKSRGNYIITLGDDDGMVPGQFAALRTIVEEHRPNILSWRTVAYAWPMPGSGRHGHVRLGSDQLFGAPSLVDTAPLQRMLLSAQSRGARLPAIYHGCVSRTTLERMRARTGSYLNARAPDVYFSNYAAFTESSYLFAEHCFSINGHGSKSSGGATRYAPSDPRAQPNLRFAAEVQTDPLVEQFPGPTPTLALIMFATFEMARRDASVERPIAPDYRGWYRWILEQDRHQDEVYPTVVKLLGDYAASTDTDEEFRTAMRDIAGKPATVPSVLRRIAKNLKLERRIVLSSRQGRVSTVATAASALDEVLGDDRSWLTKPDARRRLWREARLRAWRQRLFGRAGKT